MRATIPTNIIIEIIIGIVLFGIGLTIFKSVIHNTNNIDIDPVINEKIRTILATSPGEIVIYPSSLTIDGKHPGELGIGIKNNEDTQITISIVTDCDTGVNIELVDNTVKVNPGDLKIVKGLVKGSVKGQYNCIIYGKKNGNQYGDKQLLTIKVN